jgi:DNA-binding MarR family transcriptional regulator
VGEGEGRGGCAPGGRAEAAARGAGRTAAAAPSPALEELERLLREVAATIRQRGRHALAGFCITPPQFDALWQLKRHGEMTMGELCDRLHLASSTVTDLVDRMERGGLVRRCRDEADRRVVRLQVTEHGQHIINEVLHTRAAYLGSALGRLSPEQQALVAEAVRLLHAQVTAP